jgi:hypothetical protein
MLNGDPPDAEDPSPLVAQDTVELDYDYAGAPAFLVDMPSTASAIIMVIVAV